MVDVVVCNVRSVGCAQGILSEMLLVVVVCALSVAVDSPSFVCLGTCSMFCIVELSFSALYVVGQLDRVGVAHVPRYVTHAVPSTAAVLELAVAARYVCPP